MSPYTRGPWHYDDDTSTVDTEWGVMVAGISVEFGEDDTLANGNLIAAAPDLLAALKIAEMYVQIDGLAHEHEQVLAAIAKAEGRHS